LEIPEFKDDMWDVLNQVFTRTAIQYHQKYKQLWVISLFAIKVKEKENRKAFLDNDLAVREKLYQIIDDINPNDRSYGMLNSILHLGYPERYERMISLSDKKKAVKYYENKIKTEIDSEANLDQKLLAIRNYLEEKELDDEKLNFYSPQFQEQWREKTKLKKEAIQNILQKILWKKILF
jgi:hypothetical protein